MSNDPVVIGVRYLPVRFSGRLVLEGRPATSVWERIQQTILSQGLEYKIEPDTLELSWTSILTIIGQFAGQQKALNFRFAARDEEAKNRIAAFVLQFKKVQAAKGSLNLTISQDEIAKNLRARDLNAS
jgi:hypothetical protein